MRQADAAARPTLKAGHAEGSVSEMMSVGAVGRTAKIAGPIEEVAQEAANPAQNSRAIDLVELRIGQREDFRVRLLVVLHCSYPFKSGGPFRRR